MHQVKKWHTVETEKSVYTNMHAYNKHYICTYLLEYRQRYTRQICRPRMFYNAR